MNSPISEEDLLKIFSHRNKKKPLLEMIWVVLKRTFFFCVIVLSIYLVVNFNAIKSNFLYWYHTDLRAEQPVDESSKIITSTKVENSVKAEAAPNIPDSSIKISALSIQAPVIWKVDNNATEVAKNLENGVIQINGTSLPGQKGNIYITGHSSNYVWAKGSYNNVFALLNKLVVGDVVYLKYQGTVYTYKVSSQNIVMPTDMSVMASTSDSRLTLVTCWPVGTSLKRIVVIAKQVFPDPSKNTDNPNKSDLKKLTGGL